MGSFCRWRWRRRCRSSSSRWWWWWWWLCCISVSFLPIHPFIPGTVFPQNPLHVFLRIRHGLAVCLRFRLRFFLRRRRRRRLILSGTALPPLLPALLQQRPPRPFHRQVRVRRVILRRLPYVVVHPDDHRELTVHVELAPHFRELALLLLDVLAALAQPDPVLAQAGRQGLALEVGQDARDDGV